MEHQAAPKRDADDQMSARAQPSTNGTVAAGGQSAVLTSPNQLAADFERMDEVLRMILGEGNSEVGEASPNVRKCVMQLNIIALTTKQDFRPRAQQLIQSLINGEIGPDELVNGFKSFGPDVAEAFEKQVSSTAYFVPYMKKTLPSLRRALADEYVVIQGVVFGPAEAALCDKRIKNLLSLKRKAKEPLSPQSDAKNQRSDSFPLLSLPDLVLDQILNDYDYSTATKLTVLNSICRKITHLLRPTKRIHPFHLHFDPSVPITTLNNTTVDDEQFMELLPSIVAKLSIQELIFTEEEEDGYFGDGYDEEDTSTSELIAALLTALTDSPASLKTIDKVSIAIRFQELEDTVSIFPFLSACPALKTLKLTECFWPISGQLGMSLTNKNLKSLTFDCTSDPEALQLVSGLKPGVLEDLTVAMTMGGVLGEDTVAEMNQSGALANLKQLSLSVGEQWDFVIQWTTDLTQLSQLQSAKVVVGMEDLEFEQVHEVALRWFSCHTEGPERRMVVSTGDEMGSFEVSYCDLIPYSNLEVSPFKDEDEEDLVQLEFTQGNSKFVVERVRLMLCEEKEDGEEQEECLVCRCCSILLRNGSEANSEGVMFEHEAGEES